MIVRHRVFEQVKTTEDYKNISIKMWELANRKTTERKGLTTVRTKTIDMLVNRDSNL